MFTNFRCFRNSNKSIFELCFYSTSHQTVKNQISLRRSRQDWKRMTVHFSFCLHLQICSFRNLRTINSLHPAFCLLFSDIQRCCFVVASTLMFCRELLKFASIICPSERHKSSSEIIWIIKRLVKCKWSHFHACTSSRSSLSLFALEKSVKLTLTWVNKYSLTKLIWGSSLTLI